MSSLDDVALYFSPAELAKQPPEFWPCSYLAVVTGNPEMAGALLFSLPGVSFVRRRHHVSNSHGDFPTSAWKVSVNLEGATALIHLFNDVARAIEEAPWHPCGRDWTIAHMMEPLLVSLVADVAHD